MRLVSFDIGGEPRLGVQEGDEVIDLQAIEARFPADVRVLLADANVGLVSARRLADKAGTAHRRPLAGLDLALPVRTAGKVICLGLNYHDHAKEGGNVVAAWPAIFLRTQSSLVAAGHPMIAPGVSRQLDYEAEMVAVIGRRTRHATLSTALDANGVSTRFLLRSKHSASTH